MPDLTQPSVNSAPNKSFSNLTGSGSTIPPYVTISTNNEVANNGQQSMSSNSILEVLLSEHLINQSQYDDIKMRSTQLVKSPEELLISLGILSEEKITEARAKQLGVPFVTLNSESFSPQALSFLSRVVVEKYNLIPFFYDDKTKTLSVAMANPVDLDAVYFVRQKTGLNIKTFAAVPSEVKAAIDQQYRQELVGDVGEAIKENEESTPKKAVDSKQISQIIKEAPIAKIVSTILEYAVSSRASDVHIEPLEDRVRIRYRIDGILYDKLSLPRNVLDALVSRIKILSEMKIDEHRMPQDGRFNFKVGDQEVDLRISTVPTVTGEKIDMRLLRKSGGIPTLTELGLNGISLRSLEQSILRPHGIILVCGPTGSGKTTTLYSILARLNTTRVNIMSLEDPVEYRIPGVNQVQVNSAVGLTFASGLRAFLRQDPNIILVGEIRDKETTDLAMQAALTGHLVFSTLHTSNAAGALPRLVDLGAEYFLLASTINAIIGQRIVRRVCMHCRESYIPPQQLVEEMKSILGRFYPVKEEPLKLYKGKGCNECGLTGYFGRVGIFEVLIATDEIIRLVSQKATTADTEKEAVKQGMITMKQDGYLKVLTGETTIEEVLRVAED
ncbi:MAG TPA: GspE/PulE family protein [Patescibacteria group bacterium]|nr:GspE/PulE family protein [Patescibacteria group bacterium]